MEQQYVCAAAVEVRGPRPRSAQLRAACKHLLIAVLSDGAALRALRALRLSDCRGENMAVMGWTAGPARMASGASS